MRLPCTALLVVGCWAASTLAFAAPIAPASDDGAPPTAASPGTAAAPQAETAPPTETPVTELETEPDTEPEPVPAEVDAPDPDTAQPVASGDAEVARQLAELRREVDALKAERDERNKAEESQKDEAEEETEDDAEPELGRYSEDGVTGPGPSKWQFQFHGYARMPLRFIGKMRRAPYLVDDDYFLSGFSYLRGMEREWAELFLEVRRRNTRLVFGLFASQFSDWSEATLQGQGGIATAFVEHHAEPTKWLELDARAGMFWDRYGYIEPYDTYLHGRTHIAGGRLATRWFDYVTARVGVGGHAEVIGNNQGFTPVVYGTVGGDTSRHRSARHAWVAAGFFGARTWTRDSDREFAMDIKDADLNVYGGELSVHVARAGRLQFVASFLEVERVLSLANSLEILHSTGGRGLSQNFFGSVEDGTGQAITSALDFTLEPYRVLPESLAWRRYLEGFYFRGFGMLASIQAKEGNTNPVLNRDDRTFLKWGTEFFFRPNGTPVDFLFASYRFDRVILDLNHQSMTFRVSTPRLGFIIAERVRIFGALSKYNYGPAVFLRPNQIPGDNNRTRPDNLAFKLQAEARF